MGFPGSASLSSQRFWALGRGFGQTLGAHKPLAFSCLIHLWFKEHSQRFSLISLLFWIFFSMPLFKVLIPRQVFPWSSGKLRGAHQTFHASLRPTWPSSHFTLVHSCPPCDYSLNLTKMRPYPLCFLYFS